MHRFRLSTNVETWPLRQPFQITGHTFCGIDVLHVSIESQGLVGHGEAAGVYYLGDTPSRMQSELDAVRARIEEGIDRKLLQSMLPPGGARNALDCALWDLEAKFERKPVWELAGLSAPRPARTTYTCSAAAPHVMADMARVHISNGAQAIKLKLTGAPEDRERIQAVRAACANVWLSIDANQGFTRNALELLMPVLVDARVALIEQPFPLGHDPELDGMNSPIPIAADESIQDITQLDGLVGRFDVINIKLDKCGGLTHALALAAAARAKGLGVMVGNMLGTSLGMAPGFLLAQKCDVVDLDGPLFLTSDRTNSAEYVDGHIFCDEMVWGGPRARERCS